MATGFSVMDALNKNSKAGAEDQSPKAKFRTKDISIFKMYRNSMNFYKIKDIEELAGDILTFGLKQNLELIYAPGEEGEYRIIAGERRWEALKLLVSKGHKEFEIATCKLSSPQDEDEEQVEIIIANSYREKTILDLIEEEQRLKTSLERMRAAGRTVKGYDLNSGRLRDVIANMLKMSKTKIAQIESINNNLIPEFKEEMRKERLTFSAAYELSGMTSEKQRELLERFMEKGELSFKEIKELKEGKEEDVKGQMTLEEVLEPEMQQETEGQQETEVPDSDTENKKPEETAEETEPTEEYQQPHPDKIDSLCYSCQKYMKCNVSSSTCLKCGQYVNKAEAEKTEEQKYSEEQDRLDKETAKKLREIEDREKMNHLPSKEEGQQVHEIRLAAMYFEDIKSGKLPFLLRKNDRGYKEGDLLKLMEFQDGRNTGRMIEALITFLLEDNTGLEDDYCILGIKA